MCGRYAMGAAHINFLRDLQGQYARLFPGRGDGDDDGDGGGRPLRLRGGGPRGDTNCACQCGIKWEREQDFWPSYNLAPKQRAPVVRRDPDTGDAMIETMQWGLIPHWTKYPPTGPLNTINARSEALIDPSSGGMWHALKGHKRCVVPAQGYYEWQKKGSSKVANFVRLPLPEGGEAEDPPLLFFAGLWDTVKYVDPVPSKFVPGPDDDREPYPTGNPVSLSTFTIITTVPAPDLAWLHDREPCILTNQDDIARWLDLGETPKGWVDGKGGTADLLLSYPGLAAYPVVPEVGKIGRSDLSYILPVAERKDGIKSFLMKQSPKKAPVKDVPPPQPVSRKELMGKRGDKEPVAKHEPSVEHERDAMDEPDAKHEPGVKHERDAKEEPKAKDEPGSSSPSKTLRDTKPEPTPTKTSAKTEPAGVIDTDDGDGELPSSQSQPSGSQGKRKREDAGRRGGRQTKVVRPTPKDESGGQKPITSFFKSPKK